MFISKKRFEQAIAKAKEDAMMETEKRIWERERLNHIEEDFNRRMCDVERRLYYLENPEDGKVERQVKPMMG